MGPCRIMFGAILGISIAALLVPVRPAVAQDASPPSPAKDLFAAGSGVSGEPLSCAYCDLRGMDFSAKDLTNANLVGSDLRGAKLTTTTLDGAILIGANLGGADLSGARLRPSSNGSADLTGANLAGASFRQAVLTGAHLPFAVLLGTDFSGADLTGAELGPLPKTGTLDGRLTSFRGAKLNGPLPWTTRRRTWMAQSGSSRRGQWQSRRPPESRVAPPTSRLSAIRSMSRPRARTMQVAAAVRERHANRWPTRFPVVARRVAPCWRCTICSSCPLRLR